MANRVRPRASRIGRITVRPYGWAGGQEAPQGGRLLVRLLVPAATFAVLAAIALIRVAPSAATSVPVSAVTDGAPNGSPAELKSAAADLLAATTAGGGTGYRFEIVQRSTFTERAGGPKLDSAGAYLSGLVETGWVTPAGFYMEMRAGPASAADDVDLASGELIFRTLVRGGDTYRDDGEGWYVTSMPPGIGLDPVTAAALPRLLRNTTSPRDAELSDVERELGRQSADATRAITAQGEVADIPGVIAVDGNGFTELTEPIAFTFDEAGRLAGLLVTARNTNVTDYDLMVVTEIRLRYDDVPVGLPKPEPPYAGDKRIVNE